MPTLSLRNHLRAFATTTTVATLSACALIALTWATLTQTSPSPTNDQHTQPPPSPADTLRTAFPAVRVDAANHFVEFDASIPIDAHHPEGGIVYLELVACSPDSREHESLVVTSAKPSHIHAALLLAGAEPGSPASWQIENDTIVRVPPTGSKLTIKAIWTDPEGTTHTDPIESWVTSRDTNQSFTTEWRFGGSRFVTINTPIPQPATDPPNQSQPPTTPQEVYEADLAGTIIALTTFGSEVISATKVLSHVAAIDEPQWIANPSTIPPVSTDVTIRLILTNPPSDTSQSRP